MGLANYAYFLLLFYASMLIVLAIMLLEISSYVHILWTEFENHLNHIHKYKIPSTHN